MGKEADLSLIGRTIAGKFQIESFLGGGAMGAVYKARQIALEKTVAIKVMHREMATDGLFAARFHREAKAASRLDHPNSMRVIDFGEEPDGLLYIAMEYLDGRDLFRVLEENWPLSRERIVDLLLQVLAALAVAHDMGVVHRDLKPENIMVLRGKNDEGDAIDIVKVCDFGIAKITDSRSDDGEIKAAGQKLTTQGLVVGTPEYMSPEQGRGESLDARSDLYSVGVILYQLLTGQVPFDAESALGIVLKHVTEEPKHPSEFNPQIDSRLEAICLKAMRKQREERYQTARELRADLRAIVEANTGPLGLARTEQFAPTPAFASAATAVAFDSAGVRVPPLVPSMSKVTPLGTEAFGGEIARSKGRWVAPLLVVALAAVAGLGFSWRSLWRRGEAQTLAFESAQSASPVNASAPVGSAPGALPAVSPPEPEISMSAHLGERGKTTASRRQKNADGSPQGVSMHVESPGEPLGPPLAAASAVSPPSAAFSVAPTPSNAPIAPSASLTPLPAATPLNPSVARVVVGEVRSQGVSASQVRNALMSVHPRLTRCYQDELRKRGVRADGTGTLSLEIDDTGRVTNATLGGVASANVGGSCIVAALKNLPIRGVDTGNASADVQLTFRVE